MAEHELQLGRGQLLKTAAFGLDKIELLSGALILIEIEEL